MARVIIGGFIVNHRFIKAFTVVLITLMPVVVVGCGNSGAQKTNQSQTPMTTTSNTLTPITQPTGSTSGQASTSGHTASVQPPDASGVFQNIDQAPAAGANGSQLQTVVSSGPQGIQKVLQQTPLQPTVSQVVAPYVTQLQTLQSTYITRLYGLYNSAKAEYHGGQKSKLQILSKYGPEAITLENKAQDQVNSVLFTLRAQLAAKGLPTNEVNVLRNAYYSEVAQMQAQFGR